MPCKDCREQHSYGPPKSTLPRGHLVKCVPALPASWSAPRTVGRAGARGRPERAGSEPPLPPLWRKADGGRRVRSVPLLRVRGGEEGAKWILAGRLCPAAAQVYATAVIWARWPASPSDPPHRMCHQSATHAAGTATLGTAQSRSRVRRWRPPTVRVWRRVRRAHARFCASNTRARATTTREKRLKPDDTSAVRNTPVLTVFLDRAGIEYSPPTQNS
eukprot:gene14398-biopygen15664